MQAIYQVTDEPRAGLSLSVGKHVVSSAEATAGQVDLPTGFSTGGTSSPTGAAVYAYGVTVYTSAGAVATSDAVVSVQSGETVLRVADGSTYNDQR
jgi:hypothetical protein